MLRDNVQQTTSTAGAGAYVLDGLVTTNGVVPFATKCTFGKKYRYKVQAVGSTLYEENEGTFTAGAPNPSITRDRFIESSTGSPINWPDASAKIVSLVPSAEDFGSAGGRHRRLLGAGSATVVTATSDVPAPVLVDGMEVTVSIPVTNTGALTFNLNGTGAKAVKKYGVTLDPEAGEAPAGHLAQLRYVLASDVWQLLNPKVVGNAGVKIVATNAYNIVAADCGKFLVFTHAAGCAVTLPQATGAFASTFMFGAQNASGGNVVITPTTSTIGGAATLTIGKNTGAEVYSDGANYQVRRDVATQGIAMPLTTKAANYAMVAGDIGSEIKFTASATTLTLLAAATVGNGGTVAVSNGAASGDVTIDPNAAETLDGQATRLLRPGDRVILRSDGANWQTIDGFYSFESAEQTLALATVFAVAHGLGEAPNWIQVVFRCKTTDLNWAVGDEIDYSAVNWTYGGSLQADATNLRAGVNQTYYPSINNKSTATGAALTGANWKLVFKCRSYKG